MSDSRVPIIPGEKALEELVRRGCNFLSKVCSPAAEQFGLALADSVVQWRSRNTARLLAEAEARLNHEGVCDARIHPRIATRILDEGSWIDDDEVRSLWSNLFASSCTESAVDDSNLPFCELLSQLTFADSKVFVFACQSCGVEVHGGLPTIASMETFSVADLIAQIPIAGLDQLDFAIDHLYHLGLLGEMIDPHTLTVTLIPTVVGLRLFAKVSGCRGSVVEFYANRLKANKP